jgi:hypothetical protein
MEKDIKDKDEDSIIMSFYNTMGTYIGQIKNGKPHGNGKFISNTDKSLTGISSYDGQWIDGKAFGHGKMIYNDKHIYEGNFENNDINGEGTMKYSNGDIYIGSWKNNYMSGNGIMKYVNGNVYTGNWNNDFMSGRGIMNYANGDVYEGDWIGDTKHGKGIMKYANGDVYEGDWNNDTKDGKGMMKYVNGDVYEGDWNNDTKDGRGTMKYVNGDVYIGEWYDNLKHGKGMMKYVNGDVYTGDWKYNYKIDIGKMTYANGDVYIGIWSHDEKTEEEYPEYMIDDSDYTHTNEEKKEYMSGKIYEKIHKNTEITPLRRVINKIIKKKCPPERIPNDEGKCPESYPILKEIENCCYKYFYKPNLNYFKEIRNIDYTEYQEEAMRLYSNHGDRALSNFTINNFTIDNITKSYIKEHYFYFDYFIKRNRNFQCMMMDFYLSLVSSFNNHKTSDYLILYRGIRKNVDYKIGSMILYKSFLSTTTDNKIPLRFLDIDTDDKYVGTYLSIYVPIGTYLCPIYFYSEYSEEKELLINCGSILYIKNIKYNVKLKEDKYFTYVEAVLIDRKELGKTENFDTECRNI